MWFFEFSVLLTWRYQGYFDISFLKSWYVTVCQTVLLKGGKKVRLSSVSFSQVPLMLLFFVLDLHITENWEVSPHLFSVSCLEGTCKVDPTR